MKTHPKRGGVHEVAGGYGLMLVVHVNKDERTVQMQGHGPANKPRWFNYEDLGYPVGVEAIQTERVEAQQRGVACNNPDCWCHARLNPESA